MRWMLNGKCRQMPPEAFYVENLTPGREDFEAQLLCAGCTVIPECAVDSVQPMSVSVVLREVVGVDLQEPDDEVRVSGVVRAGKVMRLREDSG